MNEFETEREKIIKKLKNLEAKREELTANIALNKPIYYLGKIFLSALFNESQDIPEIMEEMKQNDDKVKKELENKEEGYYPWFDESLKPVSEEFGCPRCGGYCYEINYIPSGSHCEAEYCQYIGQSNIYCPKMKCKFNLVCKSVMIPIGVILDENSRYGYSKNDVLTITYKDNKYQFKVMSEYLAGGMQSDLVRRFFDYDLTRKEMNEFVILQKVENI